MAVFREGRRGSRVAYVGDLLSLDTTRASEFKRIADDEVERVSRSIKPTLARFHAVCFNYRHALELTLKELIRTVDDELEEAHKRGALTAGQQDQMARLSRRKLDRTQAAR